MAKDVVKRKPMRRALSVSKTNAKRVKTGTHSLAKVLRLEGYDVQDNHVVTKDAVIPFDAIDLWPRRRRGEDIQAPEALEEEKRSDN
jgi:hypothetical protein